MAITSSCSHLHIRHDWFKDVEPILWPHKPNTFGTHHHQQFKRNQGISALHFQAEGTIRGIVWPTSLQSIKRETNIKTRNASVKMWLIGRNLNPQKRMYLYLTIYIYIFDTLDKHKCTLIRNLSSYILYIYICTVGLWFHQNSKWCFAVKPE